MCSFPSTRRARQVVRIPQLAPMVGASDTVCGVTVGNTGSSGRLYSAETAETTTTKPDTTGIPGNKVIASTPTIRTKQPLHNTERNTISK